MSNIDDRLLKLRSRLSKEKLALGLYVKPSKKLIAIMIDNQVNRCAICEVEFASKIKAHVDHCHKTGKVRGLLCRNCNLALGLFKDNLNSIERAVLYLKNLIHNHQ